MKQYGHIWSMVIWKNENDCEKMYGLLTGRCCTYRHAKAQENKFFVRNYKIWQSDGTVQYQLLKPAQIISYRNYSNASTDSHTIFEFHMLIDFFQILFP